MKPKRLISLLVAVCMMITMLPLSAVTAFAEDTSALTKYTATINGYECTCTVNADNTNTATITEFRGPDDGSYDITIPTTLGAHTVTAIGEKAFLSCKGLHSHTIKGPIESIGYEAFAYCSSLTSLSLGEKIKTIGDSAFYGCSALTEVTIPQSVTSIGKSAFASCKKLDSLTIKDATTSIGDYAFAGCENLTTLSLGENITTIGGCAFRNCHALTNVTIPEKVTAIKSETFDYCKHLEYIILPAGFTSFGAHLEECPPECVIYYNNDRAKADNLLKNNYCLRNAVQNGHQLLCLCHVTFDAIGGDLTYDKVPVYETDKISGTKAYELTAIPNPTRAGYNFTGWYTTADGKDGKLFNVKETAITKDTTLYAHWAPVYHPLTVPAGIDTVKKGDKDVTDTLTVTTDEATGKKTYSVPEGATVTVTLDKTLIPEGMVFDIWSTGKFSLPLGQDYKAESITFTMNTMSSDVVDIAAQYRDAATVTIEGLENAVIKEGESKDFTVKVTPNDDAKLGEAFIDFGDKNSEIEYLDDNGAYQPMPEGGLPIDLSDVKEQYAFRITPKDTGKQTLTAAVKKCENELATDEKDFVVSEMPILTLKDGVITSVTVPGKNGADPEDITENIKKNANEDGSFHVPEGATVSVAFDKDAFADSGLKFGHWDITGLDDPNAYQDKESFAFEMPAKAVTLKAMTQDASIEDDEPDIVGPIVIGTTVVVGGAVLGYQAYSLGAEFAGKLMALPYFPSNRSALAMMLWEDAGKPMPESELLYPDVEQEEQDMDLQHAARWAMENELIPDLNDEGTAPEEMKFFPANPVSKLDVLNAWQKAQELKNN